MFRSYLKISWRNLNRHRFYSIVNVLGLSLALSFVGLIAAYIWGELRVSSNINDLDRQYLVRSRWKDPNMGLDITTLAPVGSTLEREYPSLVENYYRFDGIGPTVSHGDKHFKVEMQAGDSTFLSIFGFPLVFGNPHTAFNGPQSVVITEDMARKFFGKTDVVGQTLTIDNYSGTKQQFTVTGVLKDLPLNMANGLLGGEAQIFIPAYSLQGRGAGMNMDQDWLDPYIVTYIKLKPGVKAEALNTAFKKMLGLHAPANARNNLELYLTPLRDVYLTDIVKRWLVALGTIAGFILLMAVVNFTNITIGSSSSRLKEVGIRKVLGGLKKDLRLQFLTESVLIVFFAMIMALGFYFLLRPVASEILGQQIVNLDQLPMGFVGLPVIGIFLIGLMAGIYPAILLSRLKSVDSLKGRLKSVRENIFFRRSLVAFQFTVAVFVFVAAIVIARQVSVFFGQDLGYNKNAVLTISSLPANFTPQGEQHMEYVRDEVKSTPGITEVSLSYEIPNGNNGSSESMYRSGADSNTAIQTKLLVTDEKYAATFGIPLRAGQFFTDRGAIHDPLQVVINESAARALGWKDPGQAVGSQIRLQNNSRIFTVCGVVRDFHFAAFQEPITPILFIHVRNRFIYRYLSVKMLPGNLPAVIAAINRKWTTLVPGEPFDFHFMDERLAELYQSEFQLRKASYAATGLSITIVLLGVIGLVAQSSSRRTKELGIRKVLGASAAGIVKLFIREFVPMILVANLVAAPIAFFVMHRWLEDYAARIALDWAPFAIVAGSLSLITALVITAQTLGTALENPIKSLRQD